MTNRLNRPNKNEAPAPEAPSIRKTIMLARIIYETGKEMMKHKGFNRNFSGYIRDLIQRDKEAYDKAHASKSEPQSE